MWSAAIRAWYLPMCVNSALPLMSPIAYSHGWPSTCMRASTETGSSVSIPSASSPSPLVCGVRPSATSSVSPAASRPSEVVTTTSSSRCSTFSAFCPVRTSTPYSSSASVTCAHAYSSSRGSSRRSPSISVTCEPSVWNACDISTPTTPPPMITSRLRDLLRGRRLAVGPGVVDRVQPLDRRHRGQRAGGEDDGARRLELLVADPHPPLAGELADAAHERDAAVLEPRQLRRVVEVVDDLVAAVEHRRHVELAA